ncbi:NAD regulator [Alkalicaulis satelles]|uniref:NAD regulator n=1 Tax=Alkalicaulis satelles TaxID=2609175 RepID=A0A5M6ZA41_9PROT|nr:NAD regulator [Alkalicaulis satelles]KAA5800970.1 NAD regulator [Alkalicaulis satelles]
MKPAIDPEKQGRLVVGLNAVIFAADGEGELQVLVTESLEGEYAALPFGPFDPDAHRTFEIGLREWVRGQTGFELGYVEQLYTFGDMGREAPVAALAGAQGARVISVGYLGLAHEARPLKSAEAHWVELTRFFPWEDHREGRSGVLSDLIEPALRSWADEAAAPGRRAARLQRVRATFGLDGAPWNEERALDRYELLYEAGLVAEAARDRGEPAGGVQAGQAMASDHRRILATALSRLRGKVKYRPIVFELTPDLFTLSHLQKLAESISGFALHKQNFRRALDRAGFVEGTGQLESRTGGRPAELYRYKPSPAPAGALGIAVPRLK